MDVQDDHMHNFFWKIGGDIPSHFNIIGQNFWKFWENRPKNEIKKFIAQNQYITLYRNQAET